MTDYNFEWNVDFSRTYYFYVIYFVISNKNTIFLDLLKKTIKYVSTAISVLTIVFSYITKYIYVVFTTYLIFFLYHFFRVRCTYYML